MRPPRGSVRGVTFAPRSWQLVQRGIALTIAVMVAGLLRDPNREHLIPRDVFVSLLEGCVLVTSLVAIVAGALDRPLERADTVATSIAGWLGLLYVPVLSATAAFMKVGSWGCGTAMFRALSRVNGLITLCLGAAALLVACALWRDRDRRRAWRCAGLVVAMAVSVPALGLVLDRDRTKPTAFRGCYANQKTVIGAVEMYQLDRNRKVTALSPAMWETLRSGGYLQSIPLDSDLRSPESTANYQITAGGNGIRCSRHGAIQ